MSTNTIAKFQKIKIDVRSLEKQIEGKFKLFEKNQTIELEMTHDYGRRMFSLILFFDEINLTAFSDKSLNELRSLVSQYKMLRKSQAKIESQLNQDYAHEQDLIKDSAKNI